MANSESDIQTAGSECLNWDQTNTVKSLQDLRTFVEDEAGKTAEWYWREKNKKKIPSQRIQRFALLLTAAAGLTPIIIQVIKNWDVTKFKGFDSGPLASLLVGLAAALLGLDKAFGYSSGWVRYVLTATSMTKLLQEFRLDWVAIYSASSAPPTAEQQASLIQRAKTFVSDVQGLVLQETKDWATEFQSNMAQMEKDVKAQLDALKAQVDKIAKEREAGAVPGAIELTVANADKTDGFQYDVTLEGKGGKVSGVAASSKVWTQINTSPGQYKVTISAKAKGVPVSSSTVFAVQPGETVKVPLSLDIAP
jgi:SMODS and SLOG-associating 2TM effector domain 2